MSENETIAVEVARTTTPRRQVLRSLTSVVAGAMALVVLAACGGDGDNGDEEEDD